LFTSKHFLLSLFFFASAILFSSCYLLRAYKFRNFELNSHEKLPSVSVQKGPATFVFANTTAKSDYARLKTYLDTMLVSTETAAFLVIRNDSILYENYLNGFSA
jgi:hypothetical protein